MGLNTLFFILGGLGFFFFGMRMMSEGLKKIAGERLKNIVKMVTRLPVIGVLVGAFVTCVIQSSSATTVLVVGFVNAGLMALQQAISVIIGANIGTTFTAWLVSSMSVFKITSYSLPCVGIGFAMMVFAKRRRVQSWGEVILGFGMLFVGLEYMKDAFEPLKDSQHIKDIFLVFSQNPLLGVLAGLVFTVLLQSSSATIAIVQVMAFNGLISFESAIPLILGDNIGTTITAQMAAVGTNLHARRAAMAHTIFNVLGVAYALIFVYNGWFIRLVDFVIPGELTLKNIMLHIAVAHSTFNVFNALVFLPLIGVLERVTVFLVPKRAGMVELGPQYLEKHLLATPSVAMQQARNEMIYMLGVANKSLTLAVKAFLDANLKNIDKVATYERATDTLQSEITQYLIELSQKELTEEESREIPVLIHNVNDIERLGDHSENIAELAMSRIEDKLVFSEVAAKELQAMWVQIEKMMKETEEALRNNDPAIAQRAVQREGRINELHQKYKESHIDRLNTGACALTSNFIFIDLLDNMEKIGDHLTNVAQAVIGRMQWRGYKFQLDKSEDPVPA